MNLSICEESDSPQKKRHAIFIQKDKASIKEIPCELFEEWFSVEYIRYYSSRELYFYFEKELMGGKLYSAEQFFELRHFVDLFSMYDSQIANRFNRCLDDVNEKRFWLPQTESNIVSWMKIYI